MQQDYSNREIDTFLTEIKEQLNRIESQTTRTNGRVTSLESWKSYLVGAWFIVTVCVIPLILYVSSAEREALEERILTNHKTIIELQALLKSQ